MISLNEFAEVIKSSIEKEDMVLNARIVHIIKNNDMKVVGIIINEGEERKVALTIYLNKIYEEFCEQKITLEEAAEKVLSYFLMIVPKISRFEDVKDYIKSRVINYELNRKELQDIPHMRVLDLAIVFYISIPAEDKDSFSISVTNSLMERYGITIEDLADCSEKNEEEIKMRDMNQFLSELFDMCLTENEIKESVDEQFSCSKGGPQLFVVSNKDNLFEQKPF